MIRRVGLLRRAISGEGLGRQTSLTYDDKAEAERMRRVVEANGGDLNAALAVMAASKRRSATVATVVPEHISLLTGVAPGQQARYRSQLRDHLGGRLGSTPIEVVGLRDIAGWLPEMQAKGLAPKTIANVHGLLSSAMKMKTAIRLGYRTDNPCHGVKLPEGTAASNEMCLLTSSEVGLILAQMTPRLVGFLVGTGLRWGEATAVQVGDVVLDGATPSLPDAVVDELRPLVTQRGGDEFLFVNADGRPVLHPTFWPKHWAKAIDRAQHPIRPDGKPDPSAARLTTSPRTHVLRQCAAPARPRADHHHDGPVLPPAARTATVRGSCRRPSAGGNLRMVDVSHYWGTV